MTIAERIMLILKDKKMNMSQFAEVLNVTPAYISKIKNHPDTVPSDRFLNDICRSFYVNENWLKNGEGDMYCPKTRADEIADIAKQLYENNDPRYQIVKLVSTMTPRQLELVKEIAINLISIKEEIPDNQIK